MKPREEYCLHTHRWVVLDGGKCNKEDSCIEEYGRLWCPWNMVNILQQQENEGDEDDKETSSFPDVAAPPEGM